MRAVEKKIIANKNKNYSIGISTGEAVDIPPMQFRHLIKIKDRLNQSVPSFRHL